MCDQEVADPFVLQARLPVVFVDEQRVEVPVGEQCQEFGDARLDQVDAGRLQRLQEPARQSERERERQATEREAWPGVARRPIGKRATDDHEGTGLCGLTRRQALWEGRAALGSGGPLLAATVSRTRGLSAQAITCPSIGADAMNCPNADFNSDSVP
jgi:hypothetical protein